MNASTQPTKSRISTFAKDPDVYEYKILQESFIKMNDLTKMGKDGWIFCHVFASNDRNQYLFYRKKQ